MQDGVWSQTLNSNPEIYIDITALAETWYKESEFLYPVYHSNSEKTVNA